MRGLLTLTGVAALSLSFASAPASATPAPNATPASVAPTTVNSCDQNVNPGMAACLAIRRTDAAVHSQVAPNATPSGYGPTDLQSAYKLPSNGAHQTVAIVDAMDDPNAESDLANYRRQFGLPACTTANGCFRKVNENGAASPLPASDTGWAGEISLDVDMVSAVCSSCNILLIEANQPSFQDLGAAENTAVRMGAKYVSNSYGGSEDGTESSSDAFFNHPGVVITASTGDGGFGVLYPASSQFVTAVGGTSLNQGGGTRGWSETAWTGAGSGCSSDEPKPSFQNTVTTGCARKANADVSAVADPNTGVAVFQTFGANGWTVYGGTSASSPIIASVYALAGTPGAGDNPTSYPYAHKANLFDVTAGSNGSCSPSVLCTAGPGWDGPTGLGTPNGLAAFTAGGGGGPGPTPVTANNPGNQTGTVGTAVSVQLTASGGTAPITWSASGLPAGLTISGGGLISGTPTTAGTSNVTATARDSAGTSGSTSFSFTINPTGGPGGGGCNGIAPWNATTAYVPNDVVSFNGHKWTSTWFSTGAQPDAPASWAVWKDSGAC